MAQQHSVAIKLTEVLLPDFSALEATAEDFGCPMLLKTSRKAQAEKERLGATIVEIEKDQRYRERHGRRRSLCEKLEEVKVARDAYKSQDDGFPRKLHDAFCKRYLGTPGYWSFVNVRHMLGDLWAVGRALFSHPKLSISDMARQVWDADEARPILERGVAAYQEQLGEIDQLESKLAECKERLECLHEKYLQQARQELQSHLVEIPREALLDIVQANPRYKHLVVLVQRLANTLRQQTGSNSAQSTTLETLIWTRLRRLTVTTSISLISACLATFLGAKPFFFSNHPELPRLQPRSSSHTMRQDRMENPIPWASFAGTYAGILNKGSASLKISNVSSDGTFNYTLFLYPTGHFTAGKGMILQNPSGTTLTFESRELRARQETRTLLLVGKDGTDELRKRQL